MEEELLVPKLSTSAWRVAKMLGVKFGLTFPKLSPVLFVPLALALTLSAQTVTGPTVRFHTNEGDIDVLLYPDTAPITVANFLKYVNRGSYNNSIFHRSVKGFVIQGGGYQLVDNQQVAIPSDGPIQNEYSILNTRGTLAMAKLDTDPDSATTQWFFNLANNSTALNPSNTQNGGFTVFGKVTNTAGLTVMDRIAALPLLASDGVTPVLSVPPGYVVVTSIEQVDTLPPPAISTNGLITASSFGAYSTATAGSYLEIYGSNFATTSQTWAASNFTNGIAPTSLGGVSVTVNGRSAYVNYISPNQINIQVPANVSSSGQVPVIVTSNGLVSSAAMLNMAPFAAGLLAPANFNVSGKQYVEAIHAVSGAVVSNGAVSGVPAAPAVPGETLIFYGTGFGPVTASNISIAGQIAPGQTTLATAVQFQFGSSTAQVLYSGFAPGLVGVYQFNVVVPSDVSNGDVPLQVKLGGAAIPQQGLLVPVQTTK